MYIETETELKRTHKTSLCKTFNGFYIVRCEGYKSTFDTYANALQLYNKLK